MMSISRPVIGKEKIKEASKVLLSENLVQGEKIKGFEKISDVVNGFV